MPQVGYCQGMNYIAHTLYAHLLNINTASAVLVSLIKTKLLRGLYSDSVPEYHMRAWQLQ